MQPIVAEALEDYARRHSTDESALAQELAAYTRAHCRDAQMLIGPLEAALLKLLIRLIGARRVLEIGLFTGYSALSMAEALPDDGEVISCEIDPERAAVAQRFLARSPHGAKVQVRNGAALDTLPSLRGQTFDLVFLDADKENYSAYYEQALPLLRTGGLLVADNVLWSGRVLDPQSPPDRALVAFNERVQNDTRVENVLVTVRDGVMIACKR